VYHIFYHNDADGFCSAAVVQKHLTERGSNQDLVEGKQRVEEDDIVLHKIAYGDEFPFSDIEEDDFVYMVDFSLQPLKGMVQLNGLLEDDHFIWIDHHASVMEELDNFPELKKLPGAREVGKAGCELTWGYCFPNKDLPDHIYLFGSYDVWRKEDEKFWEEYVLPHHYYFEAKNLDPAVFVEWGDLFSSNVEDSVYETGRLIKAYQEALWEKESEKIYEGVFDEIPALIRNSFDKGSNSFEVLETADDFDLWVGFHFADGEMWHVSLYSNKDDVECGEIAKRLGNEGPYKSGGGHKGAAGFQTDWKHLSKYLGLEG